MLEKGCYMTINELMQLCKKKHPELVVTRCSVTNIVRWFIKSKNACCSTQTDCYPRRYKLHYFYEYSFKPRGEGYHSFRSCAGIPQEPICSLEVSALMLKESRYLTISELTEIARSAYPAFKVQFGQVMNIVRTLVSSKFTICDVDTSTYPYRYHLVSLNGYKFKVRNRNKHYELYSLQNTSKAAIERAETERQLLSHLCKHLMDESVRRRGVLSGE
jgi:hypothetical protein